MNFYALIEPLLIGLAIVASLVFMLGRIAPGLRRRLLAPLTRRLALGGAWQQRAAMKLEQTPTGCGGGCNTCGSCGPAPAAQQVKLFRR